MTIKFGFEMLLLTHNLQPNQTCNISSFNVTAEKKIRKMGKKFKFLEICKFNAETIEIAGIFKNLIQGLLN